MAAVEGWDALACRLLAARLAAGAAVRLTITTGSMAPLLAPGDRVLLTVAPAASLRVGNLVALAVLPRPLVHRVVAARPRPGAPPLVTMGDRCGAYDRPLPPQAVIGRAIAVQRGARVIRLTTPLAHSAAWLLAGISRLRARASRWPSPYLRRAVLFALRLAMSAIAAALWRTGRPSSSAKPPPQPIRSLQ